MDFADDPEPKTCWNCGELRYLRDSGLCTECVTPNDTSVGGVGSKEPAALRTPSMSGTSPKAPPTPTIEKQLDEVLNKMFVDGYDLKAALTLLITKAEQNVLDMIAQGEGWEDSRDLYAAKLGMPYKYTDRFHLKPSNSGELKATTGEHHG